MSSVEGDRFWIEGPVGPHTRASGDDPLLEPSPDGAPLALEMGDFDQSIE